MPTKNEFVPKNLQKSIFALFVFCVASASNCQTLDQVKGKYKEPINELLSRSSRPTIGQIVETLSPWPEMNPVVWPSFESRPRTLGLAEEFPEDRNAMPAVIARMEYMFPGATWNFLGRDSALMADIVEAFYLSIGQKDRVHRLNASGNSFTDKIDQSDILQFLISNGFDPANQTKKNPYIILDATSYSETSQSRELISAGYAAALKLGVNKTDLVHSFNAINIRMENGSDQVSDIEIKDRTFNRGKFLSEAITSDPNQEVPCKIVCISGVSTAYGLEWHDTFGEFVVKPNGLVEAEPGELKELDTRKMILHEQIIAINETKKPMFLERVNFEAKKLGYQFPVKKRAEPGKKLKPTSMPVDHSEKKKPKSFVEDLRNLSDSSETDKSLKERLASFHTEYYGVRSQPVDYLSSESARFLDRLRDEINFDLRDPKFEEDKSPKAIELSTEAYMQGKLALSDYILVVMDSARLMTYSDELIQSLAKQLSQSKRGLKFLKTSKFLFTEKINPLSEQHSRLNENFSKLTAVFEKDPCD